MTAENATAPAAAPTVPVAGRSVPKASALPCPALWLRVNPANARTDALTVHLVEVLRFSADGFATIRVRVGSEWEERHANVSDLASVESRALDKLPALFAELLSRPLQSAVAGLTDGSSAAPSPAAVAA